MRRGFTIHHNGPPARCVGQAHTRCQAFWAAVKRYHQQRWPGFNDIAYSFGVCPHGTIFVGRGFDKRQIANGSDQVGADDGGDAYWYTVLAFVGGGYRQNDGTWVPEERVTSQMIKGLADIIHLGRETHRCGLRVLPHNAFKQKPCPGPTLTSLARSWDGHPFLVPAPVPEEDDDMFLYSAPNQPVFFCDGGVSVGLNEATDMKTFNDQKVKHFVLDDDTFAKFRQRYPGA